MAQMGECDYVILASSAGSNSPRPVAIIVVQNDGEAGTEFRMHFRKLPRSAPGSGGSEISYLRDLFGSWKDLSEPDRKAFFEEACELSSEPLFARDIGSCSTNEIHKIISEALGDPAAIMNT